MRAKYWVVWNNSLKQWQVKKTGNEVALKNFDIKQDAIDYGVRIAKANKPSQLIIKKKDGTIGIQRRTLVALRNAWNLTLGGRF